MFVAAGPNLSPSASGGQADRICYKSPSAAPGTGAIFRMHATGSSMSTTPHILIVDDHRDIRDLLGRYLVKHGYRASVAESAEAARRTLKTSAVVPVSPSAIVGSVT